MLLLDDNPSPIDLIGVDRLLNALERAVLHDDLDPVTVGINAPWGGGKTSVLQLLQRRLQARNPQDVVVVFVRPWEYDGTTDPKTAIIDAVLAALAKKTGGSEGIKDKLRRLVQRSDEPYCVAST